MNVFERVQDAIATTLQVPAGAITAATRDEDIPAWDSLGHLNLMMALEQTFDIVLEVEDFANLKSVPAILTYLGRQGMT
jgi:acyl carrier protein